MKFPFFKKKPKYDPNEPFILGQEMVSKPGAAIVVYRIILSERGKQALTVGKRAAKNFQQAVINFHDRP